MVDDADALFGLDPLVGVGEARIGANGGDDSVGSGRDVGGAFEEEIQDGAKIPAALGVEAGGAGVAIDGAPIEGMVNGEFAVDGLRTVPADEELLDGFAIGVNADLTFATVALEGGFGATSDEATAGRGFGVGSALTGRFTGAQSGFCVGGDGGGHGWFLLFFL